MSPLVTIAVNFALLSLVTIGGVNAVLSEVHRQVVDVNHWMSGAEFRDLFVIANASPGPNMLLVTLVGWHVAGLPGALVATASLVTPCCTLAYFVAGAWHRFRGAPWRAAVQAGLAPVSVGLVLATGLLLTRGGDATWAAYAITAASAAVFYGSRANPLWLFVAAGALGLAGLV